MKIGVYSFFSGAGFLDLGFEKSNYSIQMVNEYYKPFLKAYKYARKSMNLIEPKYGFYNCDINDFLHGQKKIKLMHHVNNDKLSHIIGFIGGPPCPDFSVAGKNRGINGKNGKLLNSYKQVIFNNKPHFFLLENVKGLWVTKAHKESYQKLKQAFKRKGYLLTDTLINSLEYGVPQFRERVILFGIHRSVCNGELKDFKIKLTNFNWGTDQKYNIDLIQQIEWPKTNKYIVDSVSECPREILKELTVQYWFEKNSVLEHINSNDYFKPRQGLLKFKSISEGKIAGKSYKRLHRWRYSPTVAYGNNEVHLHPYKNRRISVAEALALQSLPKDFIIDPELTLTDKFKTIGNGVPYLMSYQIAQQIKNFLLDNIK